MIMRVLLGLAVLVSLSLTAGCTDEEGERAVQVRTMTGKNLRFNPGTITVKAQEPVQITLKNPDVVDHDIVIVDMPAANIDDDTRGGHHAPGADAAVHDHGAVETGAIVGHATPGTSARVWFTPVQPGRYNFYCSVAGHRESGMIGTLVVE